MPGQAAQTCWAPGLSVKAMVKAPSRRKGPLRGRGPLQHLMVQFQVSFTRRLGPSSSAPSHRQDLPSPPAALGKGRGGCGCSEYKTAQGLTVPESLFGDLQGCDHRLHLEVLFKPKLCISAKRGERDRHETLVSQPCVPWTQRVPAAWRDHCDPSRSSHLTLGANVPWPHWTHLKKLKSMVEYLSWIRPQHAQRKWDACTRENRDQKWTQSIPAPLLARGLGASQVQLNSLGQPLAPHVPRPPGWNLHLHPHPLSCSTKPQLPQKSTP